jgi:hypothetical protein
VSFPIFPKVLFTFRLIVHSTPTPPEWNKSNSILHFILMHWILFFFDPLCLISSQLWIVWYLIFSSLVTCPFTYTLFALLYNMVFIFIEPTIVWFKGNNNEQGYPFTFFLLLGCRYAHMTNWYKFYLRMNVTVSTSFRQICVNFWKSWLCTQ